MDYRQKYLKYKKKLQKLQKLQQFENDQNDQNDQKYQKYQKTQIGGIHQDETTQVALSPNNELLAVFHPQKGIYLQHLHHTSNDIKSTLIPKSEYWNVLRLLWNGDDKIVAVYKTFQNTEIHHQTYYQIHTISKSTESKKISTEPSESNEIIIQKDSSIKDSTILVHNNKLYIPYMIKTSKETDSKQRKNSGVFVFLSTTEKRQTVHEYTIHLKIIDLDNHNTQDIETDISKSYKDSSHHHTSELSVFSISEDGEYLAFGFETGRIVLASQESSNGEITISKEAEKHYLPQNQSTGLVDQTNNQMVRNMSLPRINALLFVKSNSLLGDVYHLISGSESGFLQAYAFFEKNHTLRPSSSGIKFNKTQKDKTLMELMSYEFLTPPSETCLRTGQSITTLALDDKQNVIIGGNMGLLLVANLFVSPRQMAFYPNRKLKPGKWISKHPAYTLISYSKDYTITILTTNTNKTFTVQIFKNSSDSNRNPPTTNKPSKVVYISWE